MRRILGLVGLSILLLVRCADQLDLRPENSLTFANAFDNEKDIVGGVNRIEAFIREYLAIANASVTPMKGSYADETTVSRMLVRTLSPDAIPTMNWNRHYQAIAQANLVLPYVDKVPMPRARKDWYKGRIAFYKALVYFDLIRRWGDCVLIENDVIIDALPKSSWVKVADYAIGQAQLAVKLLPTLDNAVDETGSALTRRSTPCKGAANALLAHLAAWKAGGKYFARQEDRNYDEKDYWEMAEQACSEVIKSPLYRLAANPEAVCTSVLVANSAESVYETDVRTFITEVDNTVQGGYFVLAGHYASYPVKPGSTLSSVNNLEFKIKASSMQKMYPKGDLRRDAYFYKLDSLAHDSLVYKTGGYAYLYKWRPVMTYTEGSLTGRFKTFYCNRIWWRLSDIILLRAECRVRLNNPDAVDDLNFVRQRAGVDPYKASEYNGDLRYAIFKERERELLLEGYRFYDIVRNGYAATELEGGFRTASEQDFIDGALFYATPLEAFKQNPLMRQSTYWFKFM